LKIVGPPEINILVFAVAVRVGGEAADQVFFGAPRFGDGGNGVAFGRVIAEY